MFKLCKCFSAIFLLARYNKIEQINLICPYTDYGYTYHYYGYLLNHMQI